MVSIRQVRSGIDFNDFVEFPYRLYKDAPLWVPPLKNDERHLLSTDLHPFWKNASQDLFLACEGGRVVGRIAAICDYTYIRYAKERCGAFGFFECANNPHAAHCLLHAAAEALEARGMDYMRGPVNPSTNYTCGLLVDGFSEPPALMMPWNPPYYRDLLESWQMYKEEDLFAYRISRNTLSVSADLSAQLEEIKQHSRFTCRKADKKMLDRDIKIMLDLYRESWARNWYFTPLTHAEEDVLVHELLSIVDTDFFVLFFHKETPCAGMVALPDLTPLLKKLRGSIGLSLPKAYLETRKAFCRGYRIMLFGIREEFRLFGLPALLFSYMLEQARKEPGLQWVEGSWVLESNTAICDLIEAFSGKITKRYRIYRKELPA